MRDAAPLLARRVEDYRWTDSPPPIPRADYEAAEAELLQRGQAIPGVVAIFDLGPVRFPGLSDIDFLYVLENNFNDFNSLRPLLRDSIPARHHVLTHNPFIVRESDFARIYEFTPILRLRLRWSRRDIPYTPANDQWINQALYLADILAESYPREFIAMLVDEPLDELALMARAKGLAYCFDLFRAIGGFDESPDLSSVQQNPITNISSAEFDAYGDAMESLRANFFQLEPAERRSQLFDLVQRGLPLSLRLAHLAAAFYQRRWEFHVAGDLKLWVTRAPAWYGALENETPRYAAVRLRHLDIAPRAPAFFGWLIREYARQSGPVGRRLASRLTDNLLLEGNPSAELLRALRTRAALRESHTQWIDQLALGFPAFVAFGYRTKNQHISGYSSLRVWIAAILDSIREWSVRQMLR